MAFAFTLTMKEKVAQEDPETMKGMKYRLAFSYTCLSGDTSGALNLATYIGGSLTLINVANTPNDLLPIGATFSGTTLTLAKAGTAVTGGYVEVTVLTR